MIGFLKKNIAVILFIVLSLIFGGCIGYSLIIFFGKEQGFVSLITNLLLSFLIMIVCIFMQIIIHETGHLTVALMRGWKFISFMAFGFILTKRDGHYSLSTMKLAGAGGQCLLLPPENGDSDFGIMLYNLGGVIFNLMFSVISGILLWTCHESLSPYLNIFLMLFSGVGICFFLVNGIPSTFSGIPNDGYNILRLREDKFSTQVFLDSLRFLAKTQSGKRPHEAMEEYYSDNKQLDMSSPFHVCALTMDLAVALDRLDFDKAHNLIALAEERWNEIIQIYKNEIAMERLFLNLIDNGDKSKIEEAINDKNIMNYLNQNATFRPSALRIQYAIALIYDKDREKADKIMERFNTISESYYNIGDTLCEKALMKYTSVLYSDISKQ